LTLKRSTAIVFAVEQLAHILDRLTVQTVILTDEEDYEEICHYLQLSVLENRVRIFHIVF